MLEAAGVNFDVQIPGVDEEEAKRQLLAEGARAIEIASKLAELKALGLPAGADTLVLGSDQVLEQEDGSILSKARSFEEAAEQLRSLSGRAHRLHSAAVLVQSGKIVWRGTETVTMRMRSLSGGFLQDYLEREYQAVRFNVGCYRIEGPGVQLFEAVEGSHFAVLGLPLLPLLAELRTRGVLRS